MRAAARRASNSSLTRRTSLTTHCTAMAPPRAPRVHFTRGDIKIGGMATPSRYRRHSPRQWWRFRGYLFGDSEASEPVAPPPGARFKGRDGVVRKLARPQTQAASHAFQPPAKQAAFGRDQRRTHPFAEALAQGGAQVANAVGKAKLDGALRRPELPGK